MPGEATLGLVSEDTAASPSWHEAHVILGPMLLHEPLYDFMDHTVRFDELGISFPRKVRVEDQNREMRRRG